jgi:hypothetical protein
MGRLGVYLGASLCVFRREQKENTATYNAVPLHRTLYVNACPPFQHKLHVLHYSHTINAFGEVEVDPMTPVDVALHAQAQHFFRPATSPT